MSADGFTTEAPDGLSIIACFPCYIIYILTIFFTKCPAHGYAIILLLATVVLSQVSLCTPWWYTKEHLINKVRFINVDNGGETWHIFGIDYQNIRGELHHYGIVMTSHEFQDLGNNTITALCNMITAESCVNFTKRDPSPQLVTLADNYLLERKYDVPAFWRAAQGMESLACLMIDIVLVAWIINMYIYYRSNWNFKGACKFVYICMLVSTGILQSIGIMTFMVAIKKDNEVKRNSSEYLYRSGLSFWCAVAAAICAFLSIPPILLTNKHRKLGKKVTEKDTNSDAVQEESENDVPVIQT